MAETMQSPSQTCGPMFGFALMFEGSAHAVAPSAAGAIRLTGRITDGAGEPLAYPDSFVEVFHGDQWARTRTDEDGTFAFVVTKPEESAGPGGEALAPHLNMAIFARGLLRHLLTRIYFPDEEAANAADPVLEAVPAEDRDKLVARAVDGGLRFDVVLQGDGETPFFAY